jgi:uncharacterized protein
LENGYAVINRKWKKGDIVNLELPMQVQQVITNQLVEENINKVAFEFGPLVYCAEEVDNGDLSQVVIPDGIGFEIKEFNVLDEETNTLVATVDGKELKLIPYFTWSNRGEGQMKVWFSNK